MVNFMSWLNLSVSLIIIGYSVFLFFKGRRINRGMMLVSTVAGLWFFVMYGLFMVDAMFLDIMDRETVREVCIKPSVFVVLCALLSWVVRSGWRNDG